MSEWEKQTQQRQRLNKKMPSFSSSLLDAIYHSIDHEPVKRRNNAAQVEEEIESLRRAIMIEKWMENHGTMSRSRHVPSNSGSSTDSSIFSSSETESSSVSRSTKHFHDEITPKQQREGRFTRTKSRAMKIIYGELKKVKEPISPGGKIASFLNTIFSSKKSQGFEDFSSIRKSRSMKENSTTTTCSLASRSSCLSKNPSSKCSNKSKRVVRFCPVDVVLDEVPSSMPSVGSRFIKKNIDSFRIYEAGKSLRRHEFREYYDGDGDFVDADDKSCASSDLFELENIGRIGLGVFDQELPVYETTSLQKMNKKNIY